MSWRREASIPWSTAPMRPARCRSTSTRSARRTTPAMPTNGCVRRRAPGSCGSGPIAAIASDRSSRATARTPRGRSVPVPPHLRLDRDLRSDRRPVDPDRDRGHGVAGAGRLAVGHGGQPRARAPGSRHPPPGPRHGRAGARRHARGHGRATRAGPRRGDGCPGRGHFHRAASGSGSRGTDRRLAGPGGASRWPTGAAEHVLMRISAQRYLGPSDYEPLADWLATLGQVA